MGGKKSIISGVEVLMAWRLIFSSIVIGAVFSLDFQESLQYFCKKL
jgi:hypothetical protein